MKVQEALKSALFTIRCYRTEIALDKKRPNDLIEVEQVISEIEDALAEIEKCEPVAEALHERNRLGYAVVDVIGTLDEIIENAQEVEVDDFLHIAIPIDKWHELQDALEEMPKRAELYTSPQPIEKCEPVAWLRFYSYQNDMDYDEGFEIVDKYKDGAFPVYTSPISKAWLGLPEPDHARIIWECTKLNQNLRDDLETFSYVLNATKAIESKLKQLNAEKG